MRISSSCLLLVTLTLTLVLLPTLIHASCPYGTCSSVQTCCIGTDGSYDCCPVYRAQCCSDGIHCCPLGYSCSNDGSSCVSDKRGGTHALQGTVGNAEVNTPNTATTSSTTDELTTPALKRQPPISPIAYE